MIVYNILIIILLYLVSLMENRWLLGTAFAIGSVAFAGVNRDTFSMLVLKVKNMIGMRINK